MKIYLNLLPEEKKEEIKRKKFFLRIIREEILFSIPILAFLAILLTINVVLKIRDQGLESSLNLENSPKEYKDLQIYEDKFNEINLKISDILKMQENHLNWIEIFYKINNIIPDDVYLSDLATDSYQVSLVGKAKTREDFLKFQKEVELEGCFSEINVPLSNLVSKENVEFQIDFEIEKNCLKNKK